MRNRRNWLRQMEAIEELDALWSTGFYFHLGGLIVGLGTLHILLGTPNFLGLYALYTIVFLLEKIVPKYGVLHKREKLLPLCLFLLFARIAIYDVIAYLFWLSDDRVFLLGSFILICSALLNLVIRQSAYIPQLFCMTAPHVVFFFAITWGIYQESGLGDRFFVSVMGVICLMPYFVLSNLRTYTRNEELQSTKNELMQAQRVEGLGRLAGGIAHDFNNILSVILGSLQLQETSKTEQDYQKHQRVALNAVERGAELSRQLLAMGRKAPLNNKPHSLFSILKEFREFASRVVPANVSIAFVQNDKNIVVDIDAGMLQNALLNLVLNANSAMPDGGLVTIRVDITTPPKQLQSKLPIFAKCVEISVTDTGNGIPKAELPYVFDPFFTNREIGNGTGLGLSMVQGFSLQSNGSVGIKSTLGKGTTVSIFLPISHKTIAQDKNKGNTHKERPLPQSPHTILLVEDEVSLCQILERKLELDGHNIISTHTADDALVILQDAQKIDFVLSDFSMPGQYHGIDVVKKAKALGIPAILMSGMTDMGNAESPLAHVDHFIEKPLNLSDLSQEIHTVLAKNTSSKAEAVL